MNNLQSDKVQQSAGERKTRVIILGAGLGALLGLISSYFYTRAADENVDSEAGNANSVSTGQMLGVLLTVLGLVRQIAELGKPKEDKKARKK